ncbi:MtnX-like HAD-IB family phosphatase [bacterium]|nr:MtnX-like HAD-IB family phosphatase [bacterium]
MDILPVRCANIVIFSDFDGTITQKDTLVYLLENFADPAWRMIEDQMLSDEINESEGLQKEFDLLNVSWEKAIKSILTDVPINPGFIDFYLWSHRNHIPLIILSGGLFDICSAYLDKQGISDIEIRANDVSVREKRWKLIPADRPRIKGLCNHCKSSSLLEKKDEGCHIVYIGDGSTDRCPSGYADTVFAKDILEDYLIKEGREFYHFDDFYDVMEKLDGLMDEGFRQDSGFAG